MQTAKTYYIFRKGLKMM